MRHAPWNHRQTLPGSRLGAIRIERNLGGQQNRGIILGIVMTTMLPLHPSRARTGSAQLVAAHYDNNFTRQSKTPLM